MLAPLESQGFLRRPNHTRRLPAQWTSVLTSCSRLRKIDRQTSRYPQSEYVCAVFHYVPLHSFPGGHALRTRARRSFVTTSLSRKRTRLIGCRDVGWAGARAQHQRVFEYWRRPSYAKPVLLAVSSAVERGNERANCRTPARPPASGGGHAGDYRRARNVLTLKHETFRSVVS